MISVRTYEIAVVQWKACCELRPAIKEALGEELPEELIEVLNKVEYLVSATKGNLHSRQEIAGLIVMWGLVKERDQHEFP